MTAEKELLKRALRQTLNTPEDNESEEALEFLASNLIKHLSEEEDVRRVTVPDAFRIGRMNSLLEIEADIRTNQSTIQTADDVLELIENKIKEYNHETG